MVTFESLQARQDKIAVVGLGYVGLPLAVHLADHFVQRHQCQHTVYPLIDGLLLRHCDQRYCQQTVK